jgi:hypothetical protein
MHHGKLTACVSTWALAHDWVHECLSVLRHEHARHKLCPFDIMQIFSRSTLGSRAPRNGQYVVRGKNRCPIQPVLLVSLCKRYRFGVASALGARPWGQMAGFGWRGRKKTRNVVPTNCREHLLIVLYVDHVLTRVLSLGPDLSP